MKSRATEEGRYSKVSRRMWVDEKFQALSKPAPNAQSLWQRLMTGPELGCIPGLFSARLGGLADALDWSKEDTQRCWDEISAQGLAEADWAAGLVWIPNAIVHNEPPNPNVVAGWRLALCELPECELKKKAIETIRTFLENLGTTWINSFDSMTLKGSRKGYGNASGKQEAGDKKQEAGEGETRAKVPHELPAEWKPTAEHAEKARENGIILAYEVEKFTSYCRANAVKAVSWNHKFTTWLLNAIGYMKRDAGRPGTTGGHRVNSAAIRDEHGRLQG